jgi:lysozyme family protein
MLFRKTTASRLRPIHPSRKGMNSMNGNASSSNTFDTTALPLILIFEGGFTDDPKDRGGRTNKGITQRVYDKYRQLKTLSLSDVAAIADDEVRDIYFNEFWLPSQCDKMPDKIATVVFDSSVNNGQTRSIKTLQRAIGATVDGIIGKETLSKIQTIDSLAMAHDFLTTKENYYRAIVQNDPTQQKFLKGWLRRVSFVRSFIDGSKTLAQIKAAW